VSRQTVNNHASLLAGLRPRRAPRHWSEPCTNLECTVHQLSPYIGKIKSSIAGELVSRYSQPGELVVDPFAGAGTIPLEAAMQGRRVFAADISPYARVLSQAKLKPPSSLNAALKAADKALSESSDVVEPDLRTVPQWVRKFFHPRTLKEIIRFAQIARRPGNEFLLACFLGILHHQRPGFLSYPSSHLVPYLRNKRYPREQFPDMYSYRELRPRLHAKIRRSFKRFVRPKASGVVIRQSPIERLLLPKRFDCLITSPPYMNALDYGRDNRLRLWFIDPALVEGVDNGLTQSVNGFEHAITSLGQKIERGLRPQGYCVFVVGEALKRSFSAHPSEIVTAIMRDHAPSLVLLHVLIDDIPDVRRTRRTYRGVKTEHVLIFQRNA
jgi:methylase of polypeptide subunit release factors